MLRKSLFTAFVFSSLIFSVYGQKTLRYIIPVFKNQGDIAEVDIQINGFPARFMFDPGATMVSFGTKFYQKLYEKKCIGDADFKFRTQSKLANGKLTYVTVVNLKHVLIGNYKLENVDGMVVEEDDAPLLIGQSVLQKFSSFTIDNDRNELILTKNLPSTLYLEALKLIPCNENAASNILGIKASFERDVQMNFNRLDIEQTIPTNPNALMRITHRVTIRFFDQQQQISAFFLLDKLIALGYSESEIMIEDMTPNFSEPIRNYIEIWLK